MAKGRSWSATTSEGLLSWAVDQTPSGTGGVILIEGEAGVGKTRLLHLAAQLGDASGMRVLRARGSELDRAFAFGLVRGLLERTTAEMPELLAGMPEQVAAIFGATAADPHTEPDVFSRLHGLYWLVAELATEQPVVLLADDLHWADTASLRWLAFMADRVTELPVLMVCAARPDEPGADQDLLDALAASGGRGHPARSPLPRGGRHRGPCADPGCRRRLRRRLPHGHRRQPVPARRAGGRGRRRSGSPAPRPTPAGCWPSASERVGRGDPPPAPCAGR